ncbi:hypothetical protein CEXT_482421 [Caerostris extrusa]|uniref:Uncharacterized protein n=1 Tax=Caerostris extrusa TaxID=172846 RepID=A0AAV4RLI1_CAEEX|nr:hypothetical protein CEXT_482421 [Caerostris extrusa]
MFYMLLRENEVGGILLLFVPAQNWKWNSLLKSVDSGYCFVKSIGLPELTLHFGQQTECQPSVRGDISYHSSREIGPVFCISILRRKRDRKEEIHLLKVFMEFKG